MMREFFNGFLLVLSFLVNPVVANESLGAYKIRHDPFEIPVLQQNTEPANENLKATAQSSGRVLRLYSTLRAGKNSMANVNGRILKVGETLDGFTLIAVYERSVVLLKNQQRTHLTLDDNYE